MSANILSKDIRKKIFDAMQLESIRWQGELDDVEFLDRLYNLETLPSFDNRYSNAKQDIIQHTRNNNDWDMYWIISDTRFDLLNCPDEEFSKFLCEMLHPVIRQTPSEQEQLVTYINEQIEKVGFRLIEADFIAGRPEYEIQQFLSANILKKGASAADLLNSNSMRKEIARIENSIYTDPELALGTSKELIESCCKTILENEKVEYAKLDFPKLVRTTLQTLNLTRDSISNDARGSENIKNILSSLSTIVLNLNELRNIYGTGHGKHGSYKSGFKSRHAQLVASCAITFALFVSETYVENKR